MLFAPTNTSCFVSLLRIQLDFLPLYLLKAGSWIKNVASIGLCGEAALISEIKRDFGTISHSVINSLLTTGKYPPDNAPTPRYVFRAVPYT